MRHALQCDGRKVHIYRVIYVCTFVRMCQRYVCTRSTTKRIFIRLRLFPYNVCFAVMVLSTGFYVFRAVNIHIRQTSQINQSKRGGNRKKRKHKVDMSVSSWPWGWWDSMWLLDGAHERYEVIYWVLFDDYDAKRNFHIFLLLLLVKLLFIVRQCAKYGAYKTT